MLRVVRLAEAIRERYGIDGVAAEPEVDCALAGQGMRTWITPKLPASIKGVHFEGVAIVRFGLTTGERCVVKLHELGHYLLHDANGLYLAQSDRAMLADRREREAQVFAGGVLIGSPRRRGFDERLQEAHEEGVPVDFLFSYCNALLVSGSLEPEVAQFVALDRMDVDTDELQCELLRGERRVRPWSPFLAASLLMAPLLRLDLNMDGAVQLMRAVLHLGWSFL